MINVITWANEVRVLHVPFSVAICRDVEQIQDLRGHFLVDLRYHYEAQVKLVLLMHHRLPSLDHFFRRHSEIQRYYVYSMYF